MANETCKRGHDLTDPAIGRRHKNGDRIVTRCMACQTAARLKRYYNDPKVREQKRQQNLRYRAKLKESSVAQ